MAFTAKILSWRFRHLNIVGCLLKRRPTKGGSRAPQDSPLATPLHSLQNNSGNRENKTYVLCPTLQTRTCIGVLKSIIMFFHSFIHSFIHCHAICVYIVFLLLIARLMRLVIILPAEVSFFFCGVVVRCSRAEPKVQGSSPTELFFFFFLFFSVSTSSFYRLMVIILVLSNM